VVSEDLMQRAELSNAAGQPKQVEFSPREAIKLRGRKSSIEIWTA
jgi:hypothetical protein